MVTFFSQYNLFLQQLLDIAHTKMSEKNLLFHIFHWFWSKAKIQHFLCFWSITSLFFFLKNILFLDIYIWDKGLNRLSPLDPIISPWPTTGWLSHSRKSLFIFLLLPLSFYLIYYLSIWLLSHHSFILSHIHTSIKLFTNLYISSNDFSLEHFKKPLLKFLIFV